MRQALVDGDHATGIQHALALNDTQLIRQAVHAAACADEITSGASDPLQPRMLETFEGAKGERIFFSGLTRRHLRSAANVEGAAIT